MMLSAEKEEKNAFDFLISAEKTFNNTQRLKKVIVKMKKILKIFDWG